MEKSRGCQEESGPTNTLGVAVGYGHTPCPPSKGLLPAPLLPAPQPLLVPPSPMPPALSFFMPHNPGVQRSQTSSFRALSPALAWGTIISCPTDFHDSSPLLPTSAHGTCIHH